MAEKPPGAIPTKTVAALLVALVPALVGAGAIGDRAVIGVPANADTLATLSQRLDAIEREVAADRNAAVALEARVRVVETTSTRLETKVDAVLQQVTRLVDRLDDLNTVNAGRRRRER